MSRLRVRYAVIVVIILMCAGQLCTEAQERTTPQNAATERREFTSWVEAGSRALQENDNHAAEEWFRKALSLDPDSIGLLNNLATSIARQGRESEAISLYQRALRLRNDDPVTRRNLGIAYFRARRYGDALPYLMKFAKEMPVFQSLDLVGLDLFALNRYRESARYLDRASRLQPKDLPTLDLLGKAYWRAGNYGGVTDVFDRVMAVAPNSPVAHFMMGLAYDIEYKEEDARKEFETVLAADPNYPDIHSSLGLVDWRQHRFEQAENEFRQQLAQTPSDPVSDYMMGLILKQKGQPSQAVPYLKSAVAINPLYKDALLTLGQCYLETEEPGKALEPLIRVTKIDPNSADAHFILARAYRQLGRTADADREDRICSRLQAHKHSTAPVKPVKNGRSTQ